MNKVILISGGTDGLGKALAKDLSGEETVVLLSRSADKCQRVAQEVGCDFVVADVQSYAQVEQAVGQVIAKHGRIDCLVNNAGVWIEGNLEGSSPEDILEAVQVNTLGPIYLTKASLPYMKERGSGRIVNVNSQAGLHVKAERSVYHALKWGG